MAWNRLAKFTNADDKHWLGCLIPQTEEENRKELYDSLRQLEVGINHDKDLLPVLRRAIDLARLAGRVEGLRDGLEMYEVGDSILNSENHALLSIIKYLHTNPTHTSSDMICNHLDRQIERVSETQSTAEAKICPREEWGCKSWREALERKPNDVSVLFSKARKILRDHKDELDALILWAKWREPNRRADRKAGEKKARHRTADGQMDLI